MATEVKHDGLGLDFEIPDITQGSLERFFEADRAIRKARTAEADDAVEGLAELCAGVVKRLLEEPPRTSSPEFAGRMEYLARQALRMASQATTADVSGPESNGFYVRAAARADWLQDITEAEIVEMRPATVDFLATRVAAAISEARSVPKN